MYRWSSATEPTLTRSELITELAASNPHLLKADVELIVATVFDRLTDALVRGDRVELRGFGTFTVKRRNARIGRNPRTGAPVSVDEKARPFFKTGRELRERLNPTASLVLLDFADLWSAATGAPWQDQHQRAREADTQRGDGIRHVAL